MKKTKYLIPFFALAILIAGSLAVSAAGSGFQPKSLNSLDWENRLSQHASLLGLTLSEMKAYWAQGKNLKDVAAEKGISEDEFRQKMKANRLEQVKNELQTLVSEGKITQAQADSRLKFMEDHKGQGKGNGQRQKDWHGQGDCPLANGSN